MRQMHSRFFDHISQLTLLILVLFSFALADRSKELIKILANCNPSIYSSKDNISTMAPSPMKLLRLPKLRRRDEEETFEKAPKTLGVKSDDEHDLVGDDEVDCDLANHMSLPAKTTFWDTTIFFFRAEGWNENPYTPDDEPTHVDDESGSLDFDENTSYGPCDADIEADENSEIRLTGEMYPRYSLDKMVKSHKLAEFSSSSLQVQEERPSLAAFLQRYGLCQEPQESEAKPEKSPKRKVRMLRLTRSPWGKGKAKMTKQLTSNVSSSTLLLDSSPKAEKQKLQRFRFGQLKNLTLKQ